jgi:hypothetical protein
VIRNVVMIRLRGDADPATVDEVIAGLAALECPGTRSYTIGRDAGLREGNWSIAIVADFVDADAYRAYDLDEEHNRLRARLGPLTEAIARCQFEVGDAATTPTG